MADCARHTEHRRDRATGRVIGYDPRVNEWGPCTNPTEETKSSAAPWCGTRGGSDVKATFPIITCDHEDGCDQWTLDWYEALVSNWRECMAPGWQYNPHRPHDPQLCPEHTKETIK